MTQLRPGPGPGRARPCWGGDKDLLAPVPTYHSWVAPTREQRTEQVRPE